MEILPGDTAKQVLIAGQNKSSGTSNPFNNVFPQTPFNQSQATTSGTTGQVQGGGTYNPSTGVYTSPTGVMQSRPASNVPAGTTILPTSSSSSSSSKPSTPTVIGTEQPVGSSIIDKPIAISIPLPPSAASADVGKNVEDTRAQYGTILQTATAPIIYNQAQLTHQEVSSSPVGYLSSAGIRQGTLAKQKEYAGNVRVAQTGFEQSVASTVPEFGLEPFVTQAYQPVKQMLQSSYAGVQSDIKGLQGQLNDLQKQNLRDPKTGNLTAAGKQSRDIEHQIDILTQKGQAYVQGLGMAAPEAIRAASVGFFDKLASAYETQKLASYDYTKQVNDLYSKYPDLQLTASQLKTKYDNLYNQAVASFTKELSIAPPGLPQRTPEEAKTQADLLAKLQVGDIFKRNTGGPIVWNTTSTTTPSTTNYVSVNPSIANPFNFATYDPSSGTYTSSSGVKESRTPDKVPVNTLIISPLGTTTLYTGGKIESPMSTGINLSKVGTDILSGIASTTISPIVSIMGASQNIYQGLTTPKETAYFGHQADGSWKELNQQEYNRLAGLNYDQVTKEGYTGFRSTTNPSDISQLRGTTPSTQSQLSMFGKQYIPPTWAGGPERPDIFKNIFGEVIGTTPGVNEVRAVTTPGQQIIKTVAQIPTYFQSVAGDVSTAGTNMFNAGAGAVSSGVKTIISPFLPSVSATPTSPIATTPSAPSPIVTTPTTGGGSSYTMSQLPGLKSTEIPIWRTGLTPSGGFNIMQVGLPPETYNRIVTGITDFGASIFSPVKKEAEDIFDIGKSKLSGIKTFITNKEKEKEQSTEQPTGLSLRASVGLKSFLGGEPKEQSTPVYFGYKEGEGWKEVPKSTYEAEALKDRDKKEYSTFKITNNIEEIKQLGGTLDSFVPKANEPYLYVQQGTYKGATTTDIRYVDEKGKDQPASKEQRDYMLNTYPEYAIKPGTVVPVSKEGFKVNILNPIGSVIANVIPGADWTNPLNKFIGDKTSKYTEYTFWSPSIRQSVMASPPGQYVIEPVLKRTNIALTNIGESGPAFEWVGYGASIAGFPEIGIPLVTLAKIGERMNEGGGDIEKITPLQWAGVAGTAALEGLTWGVGGKAIERGAEWAGLKLTAKLAEAGADTELPWISRVATDTAARAIPIIGTAAKRAIDTYFISELGSSGFDLTQDVWAGNPNKTSKKTAELLGGLAGFSLGTSKLADKSILFSMQKTGFISPEVWELYKEKPEAGIRKVLGLKDTKTTFALEPAATQYERALSSPELYLLRKGYEKQSIRPDWFNPEMETTTAGNFQRITYTPEGRTLVTFGKDYSFSELFKNNLETVKKEGLKGPKAYIEAYLRTPVYENMIILSKIKNPDLGKLSPEDYNRIIEWKRTSTEPLPKDLQQKLIEKNTIISDKLREYGTKEEAPEVEVMMRTIEKELGITGKKGNIVFDPTNNKFRLMFQDKTSKPMFVDNIIRDINLNKYLAKESAEFIKKKIDVIIETKGNEKLVPDHNTPHLAGVQSNLNVILDSPAGKTLINDLTSKYSEKTKAKVVDYLQTTFGVVHDLAKKQSSSSEITGMEHPKLIADVYKKGFAKEFDPTFYELPKDIQGKMINAWSLHQKIQPGGVTELFNTNPLALALANADRFDFVRFTQGVNEKYLFKAFDVKDRAAIVEQYRKEQVPKIVEQNIAKWTAAKLDRERGLTDVSLSPIVTELKTTETKPAVEKSSSGVTSIIKKFFSLPEGKGGYLGGDRIFSKPTDYDPITGESTTRIYAESKTSGEMLREVRQKYQAPKKQAIEIPGPITTLPKPGESAVIYKPTEKVSTPQYLGEKLEGKLSTTATKEGAIEPVESSLEKKSKSLIQTTEVKPRTFEEMVQDITNAQNEKSKLGDIKIPGQNAAEVAVETKGEKSKIKLTFPDFFENIVNKINLNKWDKRGELFPQRESVAPFESRKLLGEKLTGNEIEGVKPDTKNFFALEKPTMTNFELIKSVVDDTKTAKFVEKTIKTEAEHQANMMEINMGGKKSPTWKSEVTQMFEDKLMVDFVKERILKDTPPNQLQTTTTYKGIMDWVTKNNKNPEVASNIEKIDTASALSRGPLLDIKNVETNAFSKLGEIGARTTAYTSEYGKKIAQNIFGEFGVAPVSAQTSADITPASKPKGGSELEYPSKDVYAGNAGSGEGATIKGGYDIGSYPSTKVEPTSYTPGYPSTYKSTDYGTYYQPGGYSYDVPYPTKDIYFGPPYAPPPPKYEPPRYTGGTDYGITYYPTKPGYPTGYFPEPPKLPPPREIKIPSPFPSVEPQKVSKKKGEKGYEVYVRRRKIYQKESPYVMTKGEALTFGAKRVLSSAAATFQLRASTEEAVPTGITSAPDLSKTFRAPKRKEAPETYIQMSGLRIESRGEIKEISLVGAAKRAKVPRSPYAIGSPITSVPKSQFTPRRFTSPIAPKARPVKQVKSRPTTFLKSKAVKGSKSKGAFF